MPTAVWRLNIRLRRIPTWVVPDSPCCRSLDDGRERSPNHAKVFSESVAEIVNSGDLMVGVGASQDRREREIEAHWLVPGLGAGCRRLAVPERERMWAVIITCVQLDCDAVLSWDA